MYKAVLTLLVGLMLSLGGGASSFASGKNTFFLENNQSGAQIGFSKSGLSWFLYSSNNDFFKILDSINKSGEARLAFSLSDRKNCRLMSPKYSDWSLATAERQNGKLGLAITLRSLPKLATYDSATFFNVHIDDGGRQFCFGGINSKSGHRRFRVAILKNLPWRASADDFLARKIDLDDFALCSSITFFDKQNIRQWKIKTGRDQSFFEETQRRGLSCGVDGGSEARIFSNAENAEKIVKWNIELDDFGLCSPIVRYNASGKRQWKIETARDREFQIEAKRRGLTCGVDNVATTRTPTVKNVAKPTLIADTNPQELYYSALDKALAQEYALAAVAFAEFLKMHPSHAKSSQALFWLGQMEFMNGKFDNAAITLSEFNSQFPDDDKILESTALIAETVCHFAPTDQAITIYKKLPNLLAEPSMNFTRRLEALEGGAPCLMPYTHSASLIEKIKKELDSAPSSVKEILIVHGQKITPTQATTNKVAASSIDLEAEREKRLQAEAELAALRAEKAQQRQKISADNQVPLITIVSAQTNGPQGTISGRVSDNTGVAEVRIDGKPIGFDATGNFSNDTYVPEGGISVIVEAFDLAGLSTSMAVRLDRVANQETASLSFDRLNPLGRNVSNNPDALALIIGVDRYAKTPARAIYADTDAQVFKDYATQKLGISPNKIRTLINDTADEANFLLSVKNWLARAVKQEQSDVYIFFAGHGLPSADGAEIYLLPYDGTPELPEETTISRKKLFADIAAANPRSVTVFLDTCYSGVTRGDDFLIAARPAFVRVAEQSIPDGFTVMTAAAGDQTAKPLEEAKHGMFSYFLMKGMEGDADANQDNQITAGELHAYVQQNVIQQSSGSQTPELQGDADRVLVRFQ